MVSKDVSLQNMDFQEEDYHRAVTLYENLNATACFYTTALRILSKANWSKLVSFDNHIGHQARVAVAKGWTCAARLPDGDNHYRLALAMSTLPDEIHKDLLRTYEAIVAIIPPPFQELISSKVLFTCRRCQKSSERDVAVFIVTSTPTGLPSHFAYFEAAFPWSENLLPVSNDGQDATCQECAIDFDWSLQTGSPCRLVWLQYVRNHQPLATGYAQFLGKDAFQSSGQIWQCIASVIHQGPDHLNGEPQPSEHVYLLEYEGSKPNILKYDNSNGLHYANISLLKGGDRICGLLYRISIITSTWSSKVTRSFFRNSHLRLRSKFSKNKPERNETRTQKRKRCTKRTVDSCPRQHVVRPAPYDPREL